MCKLYTVPMIYVNTAGRKNKSALKTSNKYTTGGSSKYNYTRREKNNKAYGTERSYSVSILRKQGCVYRKKTTFLGLSIHG